MSDWLEIHALVDGQLSGEEKKNAEKLLKESDDARREFFWIQLVKSTVQSKCCGVEHEAAWDKCRKRIVEIEKTRRAEAFVGRYAWGICGGFFAIILGAAMFNRATGGGLRAADVAHLSSGMIPISAPSSNDQNAQEQWVRQTTDAQLHVHSTPILVRGGARGTLDGKPVIRVDMQDDRGRMMLFVVQQTQNLEDVENKGQTGYSTGKLDRDNFVSWNGNDAAFLLVGNREAEDLQSVADRLRAGH